MKLYSSVYEYGEAEYVVEKSRFIAHVQPIESYEEGQLFVSGIKNEYKDATHNVPAIIAGLKQEMQWASDDGEPSGTSGLPMLKMIADVGLTNIAVVVTRYFGGIKLGTGGLARAYTAAAKAGINAAGICEVLESASLVYQFDYSLLDKLRNISREGNFEIGDIQYTDRITAELNCLAEYRETLIRNMKDLSSDRAVLVSEETKLLRNKVSL